MKKSILFELCAESLQSAITAEAGGANRLELCGQLSISGITPDVALMADTIRAVSIPVHVLIRPRGGDFVYTDEEFAVIQQQTLQAKAAGAAGVAIGLLLSNGRIDVKRTREIAELDSPLNVTFHRAFDETTLQSSALEDVIQTGANCLLTSGGQPNVLQGADQIASLHRQADGRITVMAGGGLSLVNMLEVARRTGVSYLHGSLIRKRSSSSPSSFPVDHVAADFSPFGEVLLEDVKEAIRLLNDGSPKKHLKPQFAH